MLLVADEICLWIFQKNFHCRIQLKNSAPYEYLLRGLAAFFYSAIPNIMRGERGGREGGAEISTYKLWMTAYSRKSNLRREGAHTGSNLPQIPSAGVTFQTLPDFKLSSVSYAFFGIFHALAYPSFLLAQSGSNEACWPPAHPLSMTRSSFANFS